MESSCQLRNFAEIAVKLPKLGAGKKKQFGGITGLGDKSYKTAIDFRTQTMRWPKEILRVQKSAVNIRPEHQLARTIKLSKEYVANQKQKFLKIDPGENELVKKIPQLPLAINKYVRPGKQSPKALLYFKGKNREGNLLSAAILENAKKSSVSVQSCCGSFCNYEKIAIDQEDSKMRRISKKHLEIAKEYENLIELFFKETEEIRPE